MATKALYDRTGSVIAFLVDDRRIVSLRGKSLAWFNGPNVYDYGGRHVGWWEGDHLRGADGGVVSWLAGARTGIMTPIPRIPPIPPIPSIEPIRPIPRLPPLKPLRRYSWSNQSLPI